MAFVSVPKDLSKVKSKVAFNLTQRQLICFGTAAAVGIPFYILTKDTLGTSTSGIFMVLIMLPFFFLLFYGNVIIPFRDHFPHNNLYRIMSTKLTEKI